MRSDAPSSKTASLDVLRASMRGWLVSVLTWMVDTLDTLPKRGWMGALIKQPLVAAAIARARREVTADLRRTVRELRMLLVAHAYLRVAPIVERRRATSRRPLSVPPGFRLARHRAVLLRQIVGPVLKGVHAGSLRERAERLRDMLDNLDPLITRVAARFVRMLRHNTGVALVLLVAQDALRHLSRRQPAFANTS